MTSPPSLLVLAAGVGRRFGGLKQLEPIGPSGEILLEYSVFDAIRAGFERVVLVIRAETEGLFRDALESKLAGRVDVSYVYQRLDDLPLGMSPDSGRRKPWGTAHAVWAARHEILESFAVVNADDFYGRGAYRVLADFLADQRTGQPPTFGLAGFQVATTLADTGAVSRGLCRVDDAGWLEEIIEVPELEKRGSGGAFTDAAGIEREVAGDALVSMNMWGFSPAIFPEIGARLPRFLAGSGTPQSASAELLIPDVIQEMIREGRARVRVLRHCGSWCGITHPDDREPVRRFISDLIREGHYPEALWD